MPKQRGVFKINGTFDNTTFYEKDGVFFARRASKGPSKQDLLTSPRYARTRENMSEFGGMAVTTKSLASALNKASQFRDSTLRQRLMTATRSIIKNGEGVRGQRSALLVPNKPALLHTELNVKEPVESLFIGEVVATHDAGRAKGTMVITGDTVSQIVTNAPPGATHVRFVQLLGIVSNTVFDETLKKYIAANAVLNGKHTITYSNYLDLKSADAVNVQLQTSLPDGVVPTADVAVIQCFGILFDALEKGIYYPQAQGKAMTVSDIF